MQKKTNSIGIIKGVFQFADQTEVYLIFFLDVEGTEGLDIPLVIENKIAFFTKSRLIAKIEELNIDLHERDLDNEIDFELNLNNVLNLLKSKQVDHEAIIINWLNTMLDIVNYLNTELPKGYRDILHALADHLTFHRAFGNFMREINLSKEKAIDVILWMHNEILANAILIS